MKLIERRLDYSAPWQLPDLYLFTGNPIRRNDGGLVMGRGAARQVRDSYPGIDQRIKTHCNITFTLIQNTQWIGWFKVKKHFMDDADLSLIAKSTLMLRQIATHRKDCTFHMNFPGIGNGRLQLHTVQQVVQQLPNNVLLYI